MDIIPSTTSATIITCLDRHFSRFGVPDGLRTDNGPNLVCCENRSLLKAMRVSKAEGKQFLHKVQVIQ